MEDFKASVVKVTDGDTIRVATAFRKFDFPIRLSDIAAPERGEKGGIKSQRWLENQILGKEIDVEINPRLRVGKWGRLLGTIVFEGRNLNDESLSLGYSVKFGERKRGEIPDFNIELENL
jgi:endonuclease YncB( thermonuclease family)